MTILKSPVPLEYLQKNNLACNECGARAKSYEEAVEMLEVGICRECLTKDHVYGEYLDFVRDEVAEMEGGAE